ncbi:hypothetical protein MMC30_005492 [Trapelia coarctata]|nr:hypothetical protein [Trapelia coarctata]
MPAANEPEVNFAAVLKLLWEISAGLGEQTELLRSLRVPDAREEVTEIRKDDHGAMTETETETETTLVVITERESKACATCSDPSSEDWHEYTHLQDVDTTKIQ